MPKSRPPYLPEFRRQMVELGNCIMELATVGQKEGNLELKLEGALGVLDRYRALQQNSRISAVDDGTDYLRKKYENVTKKNPHCRGMV